MAQTGYTPIQLYYSTTASAVPTNTNLANGELAINITDGKLYYKDNTGTVKLLTSTGSEISPITNNGVVYINGSGQATSGSALTFSGANLGVGTASASQRVHIYESTAATGAFLQVQEVGGQNAYFGVNTSGGSIQVTGANPLQFAINGSEQMRLTSTGLGIGLGGSSPAAALDVTANAVLMGYFRSSGGLSNDKRLTITSGGDRVILDSSNNSTGTASDLGFTLGGSETMRLTSTSLYTASGINVGIGTSSPAYKLDVSGSANITSYLRIGTTPATGGDIRLPNTGIIAGRNAANSSNRVMLQLDSSDSVLLQEGSVTINSAGNLGLGVTPSAWSLVRGLQNGRANLVGYASNAEGAWLTNNAYYNGSSWVYQTSSQATMYQQLSGVQSWHIAGAGTAGNTFSFTQAMTLDASGNLGVGTTSPSARIDLVKASGSGDVGKWSLSGGAACYMYAGGSVAGIFDGANSAGNGIYFGGSSVDIRFQGSGSERLRIASNGAWGLAGANYGTAGQVLTSNGSGSAPTWQAGGGGGGSAATPTALGTVYGSTVTGSIYGTALGYQAANSITSGAYNNFVGATAGYSTTSGTQNQAFGNSALYYNTTGGYNVAVGGAALFNNTTGYNGVAVGYQAGYSHTTNSYLTAVGYQAGYANTGSYNTFIGGVSGVANTSGIHNTAVGVDSFGGNTTGSYNTAIGRSALTSNTTASNNTAVGYASLYNVTTGTLNTAIGFASGQGITTGIENTFLGYYAGQSGNGSGTVGVGYQAGRGGNSNSVWIGYNAGQSTSNSGNHNVGLGFYAGVANTTGSSNIFIGYNVGGSNTTGANNVFIGSEAGNATGAGMANTSASNNVAIGASALRSNTTATGCTVVGYQAVYSGTNVPQVTAVGYQALKSATDMNTAIGYQAGFSTTSGYNNLYAGHTSGNGHTTGAYATYIGFGVVPSSATVSSELVVSSGYNGGTTAGKGASTGFINGGGGGTYQGNNSSSWSTTSDQRLKKNIADNNDGLDKINSIRVRNFEYRLPEEVDPELKPSDAIGRTGVQLGVIAQELQAVLPECVKQESTGVLSVDTDNLTWYLVNAVKQLSTQVETLKAEIAALKGN